MLSLINSIGNWLCKNEDQTHQSSTSGIRVVGYTEIPFTDKVAHASRKLFIWYPVASNAKGVASENLWDSYRVSLNAPISAPQSKKPIIIVSHGYGGTPHQLSWLIERLVDTGSIVIGTQHLDIPEGKVQLNHWKRPQDIQRIIDLFSSSPFSKWADLNKIGIAGFSLGGTTAIWLEGGKSTKLDGIVPGPNHACKGEFDGVEEGLLMLDRNKMSQNWSDHRIKAAFIMAPAWAWIFDEKSLQKISTPTYLIAAERDHVIVTENNAGFFAKHIPSASYQTIPGEANHYVFVSQLSPAQKAKLPPYLEFLLIDHPTVDRSQSQREIANKAVQFFYSVFSR